MKNSEHPIALRYNYKLSRSKIGGVAACKDILNVQVFDWDKKVALFTGTEKEAKEKLEEFRMAAL